MRKVVLLLLLGYIVAHTFYFIYSLIHVSYTRREFSKRDLSDGPLVLKEGVVAKKGKVIALNKKPKKKPIKEPVHVGEFSTAEANSMSSSKHLIYFTVVNGAFEKLTLNWLCNLAIFKVCL
ncbi:hypothetical protein COOONC_26734 [Cooperia oncophora]